jgi:hypothetical protein
LSRSRPSRPWKAPESSERVDLLSVDPAKIDLVAAGADTRARLTRLRGAVEAGNWDRPSEQRFTELDAYRALKDVLTGGKRWQETSFYRRVVDAINSGTPKWGCTTESEFAERLTIKVEGLYREIRDEGYRAQHEQPWSTDLADEVTVGITRDGRFMFLDGKHRLSIARLLQLPAIPVRVAIRHRAWVDFKQAILEHARARDRARGYQSVDHPDLVDIPAYDGMDVSDLLKGAPVSRT